MNFLVVSQRDWSDRAKMVMLQINQPSSPLNGYRFQKMMPKSVKLDVGKLNQLPYFITRDMFTGTNLSYATRSLLWQLKQAHPKSEWSSIDSDYSKYASMLEGLQKLCTPPEDVVTSPQQTKPSEFIGQAQRKIIHIIKIVKYMQSGTSEYGYGYGHYTQTEYSRFKAIDQQGNVVYLKFTGQNNSMYHDQGVQGKVFMISGSVFSHKIAGSGLKYTAIGRITKLQQLPSDRFNSIDPSAGFVRRSMGGLGSLCSTLMFNKPHQLKFTRYASKMRANSQNFNFNVQQEMNIFGKKLFIWGMTQEQKVVLCLRRDLNSDTIPQNAYVIEPFMLYYLK